MFHPERLEQLAQWKKPQVVFVNSMSDLFHEEVTDEQRRKILVAMLKNPQHVYIVLTKRYQGCYEYLNTHHYVFDCNRGNKMFFGYSISDDYTFHIASKHIHRFNFFLSIEPMIQSIQLNLVAELSSWVIVGGEGGPNARPMQTNWVRSIRDECYGIGVPFFFKQWGDKKTTEVRLDKETKFGMLPVLDGKVWCEFPEVINDLKSKNEK